MMRSAQIRTHGVATGGAGVGRDEDGKVTFVAGALPQETVDVEITRDKKSHAFGKLKRVSDPAQGRIEPICPNVARGCGGCGFSHASHMLQLDLKESIARENLQRLGHIEEPIVTHAAPLPTRGFRTSMHVAVANGKAALREAESHDLVPIESCQITHPLLEELLVEGDFGSADKALVRIGANTGERMVHLFGGGEANVPDDVLVMVDDRPSEGGAGWIHEEVANRTFQISARSFFQTRTDGAELLVETVLKELEPSIDAQTKLVDLCAGVGLFSLTVPAAQTFAVESNADAIADLTANLKLNSGKGISGVSPLVSKFERWEPVRADVVVADPARAGLGKVGVEKVCATGADHVVLVSCDSAAMGRDVGLFGASGYRPGPTVLVDMFPDTPHIEAVTSLRLEV